VVLVPSSHDLDPPMRPAYSAGVASHFCIAHGVGHAGACPFP